MPSLALAGSGTVAIPPLVVKGVDPKLAGAATASIAMEVDFSGAFETTNELKAAPSGWGSSCLSSTSCLSGVAKGAEADFILSG